MGLVVDEGWRRSTRAMVLPREDQSELLEAVFCDSEMMMMKAAK
jgi:hypothetical protein